MIGREGGFARGWGWHAFPTEQTADGETDAHERAYTRREPALMDLGHSQKLIEGDAGASTG
jgi:hypothetical protein